METTEISRDAMLAGLHDIRLPPTADGGLLAELLVAAGLALILALLMSFLLPLIAKRRTARGGLSLDDRIERLRELPEEDHAIALLHLARETAPEAFRQDSHALYERGGLPEAAALEARIRSAVREARNA